MIWETRVVRTVLKKRRILICGVVIAAALAAFSAAARAQKIVDKTVAIVSDGVRKPELITYSDLVWQLALQPNTPLDPPKSEDLNRALRTLIDQRVFAL